MVLLFFKMSEIMPNMTVLFEAEALSQEWPVVVLCGKGVFINDVTQVGGRGG